MKKIIIVCSILFLFAGYAVASIAQEEHSFLKVAVLPYYKRIAFNDQLWRFVDKETGVICYVTDKDHISCVALGGDKFVP